VQEQEVQVIDFEGRQSGDSGEVRLIHTDSGVFMNSDTLWWLKFNSSDVQTNLIRAKQLGKKMRSKLLVSASLCFPNIRIYWKFIELFI
jgi:hypothetical protein